MSSKRTKCRNVVLSIVAVMGVSVCLNPALTYAADPIGPKLTPRLKELLIDEMLLVKQAMTHIMNGIITGDHDIVVSMSSQIRDSFILKRELTEQDTKDLMAAAPPEFLKLDDEFHELSGALVTAGEQKNYDLERYYYGRLLENCQDCHSEYVTDKFPAFSGDTLGGHSH